MWSWQPKKWPKRSKNRGKWPYYGYFWAIGIALWRRDSYNINIYWHPWFGPILSTFGCLEVSFPDNSSLVWLGVSEVPAPLDWPWNVWTFTFVKYFSSSWWKHIWQCTILCKKVPKTNYKHKYNQYKYKHRGVPVFSLHEEVRGFVTYSNREVACLPLHLILVTRTLLCVYFVFVWLLFCICIVFALYLRDLLKRRGFSPHENPCLPLIW